MSNSANKREPLRNICNQITRKELQLKQDKEENGDEIIPEKLVKEKKIAHEKVQKEKKDGDGITDFIQRKTPQSPYWKEFAEKKRIVLKAALEENEDLYHVVQILKSQNEELKALAKRAEALEEIIREVLDNDSELEE